MPIATGHEREELEAALQVYFFFLFLNINIYEIAISITNFIYLGKERSWNQLSSWPLWYQGNLVSFFSFLWGLLQNCCEDSFPHFSLIDPIKNKNNNSKAHYFPYLACN